MESTRNDTHAERSSVPGNINRCTKLTATICLVVANVAFFGSVFTIVWLFQNKLPYKYAVVCFMVGSGMLYIVAFTSTLLLLTSKPSRSRSTSREPNVAGLTSCVRNEGCDAASDISYRGGSHLLQLPQRFNVPKTPPPPYKEPSEISSSQNDMVQTTQDSNNSGNSLNRLYYELNKDEVQKGELVVRQRPFQQECKESGSDIEMQTKLTSSCITGSSNSYPVTKALRQQMASKSKLIHKKQNGTFGEILQEPFRNSKYHESEVNSDNSPRSALKVKRNPSQAGKRKLKTMLSMSHSDLHSGGSLNSRSNLNPEGRASGSDFNGDSLQFNLNSQASPRIFITNAEVQTSQSISNLGEKQRDPRLGCNEEIRSSQSNLNSQGTPRIIRSNPEVGISLSNLNPQGTPRISRSNAGVATSQLNLSSEGKLQASRLEWNAEAKSSMSNLKSEGTPRFSRSNIIRTSQMNLIPEAGLQAFQSRLNVDRSSSNLNPEDRKVESLTNLNYDRKQIDSISNYILSTDRTFTSHSNLHLNAQQSNSNSKSCGMQRASQMDTNSKAFPNIPHSNMVGVDLKKTSQPVQRFQKLSQPQQFEARSQDVLTLQKAQSFTSLSVTNPLKIETLHQRTYQERLPDVSSSRQMSGRSIESVLDATRNSKQLTPQEWTAALNHSFLKMPKEAERVAGVRI